MKALAGDLKTIYTAANEEVAYNELVEVNKIWKDKYPNATQIWLDNWDSISVFFKFPPELRKIMYTTNAIESLNSIYKRINRNRSVFPTNLALLKTLYLATIRTEKRWTWRQDNWDLILMQLKIRYEGRIS